MGEPSLHVDLEARRPIKTRQAAWARHLARACDRWGLSPNHISMLSVVFAAGAAALMLASASFNDQPLLRAAMLIGAAAGIQLRLLCNLLDGMVAVEGGKATASGSVFNELPDRFADAVVLVAAGLACGYAWAIHVGYVAAMLAILTAYIRAMGAAAGAPQDFSGPMAKPQRMACMTAACVIAAIEPAWHWQGQSLAIALVIVAAGTAWTVARRTMRLIRALQAGPPPTAGT